MLQQIYRLLESESRSKICDLIFSFKDENMSKYRHFHAYLASRTISIFAYFFYILYQRGKYSLITMRTTLHGNEPYYV